VFPLLPRSDSLPTRSHIKIHHHLRRHGVALATQNPVLFDLDA
jgi:hypothetical protein